MRNQSLYRGMKSFVHNVYQVKNTMGRSMAGRRLWAVLLVGRAKPANLPMQTRNTCKSKGPKGHSYTLV